MKRLVVVNNKGGVGKTALVVNLAWSFAKRGLKVAVIDLDVQGNCSFSLDMYRNQVTTTDILFGNSKELPEAQNNIVLYPSDKKLQATENHAVKEIAHNLQQGLNAIANTGCHVCLLDSPAALGIRFMAGLLTADYVLAPIELEAYSIQGIKQLVMTIGNARKVNSRLHFLGMLANKVDGRNPRHREHLRQLQEAYPGLLLPTTLGLRASVAEALVTGQPVWTNRKTAARTAAREIEQMADLVFERMGLGSVDA